MSTYPRPLVWFKAVLVMVPIALLIGFYIAASCCGFLGGKVQRYTNKAGIWLWRWSELNP